MLTFPRPLVEGTLIKRYKRFLADVRLGDGSIVTAHCANTGSMSTCGSPGDQVYLLHQPDPSRKLAYSWELTATTGGFVGINTARPNQLVHAAVTAGAITELAGYAEVRREVAYGTGSRIDLLLSSPERPKCYVEIKNATLLAGQGVLFPDAVTTRGQKHLQELATVAKSGARAVLFFLVNRPEGGHVGVADQIDPTYGRMIREVSAQGVEVIAYRAQHTLNEIRLHQAVEVVLNPC